MLINLINFGSDENKYLDISDKNNLQLFINHYLVKDKVQECRNSNLIFSCCNKKCRFTPCSDDCPSCPVKNNSKNVENFLDFKKNEKLQQYYTFTRIQPSHDEILTNCLTGGIQIISHIFYTNYANILLVMVSGRDQYVTTLCHKFDSQLTSDNLKDVLFFNDLSSTGSNELVNIKNYIEKQYSYETSNEYIIQKDGLCFTQLIKLFNTIINDKQPSTTVVSKKFIRNK